MEIFFKKLIADISFLMLRILDGIMSLFKVFAGTSDLPAAEGETATDLVTYFLSRPKINSIFLWILIISVAVLAIFTAVAMIKTMTTTKKTQGKVMAASGAAFLAFFVMQIVLFAGINLSNQVLRMVDESFDIESELTMSQRIIDISVGEEGWRAKDDGTLYSSADFVLPTTADEFFGYYKENTIGFETSPGYNVTVDEEGNETIDYNKDTYDPKSNGKADLFQTNLFILFFATATIFLLIVISLIELSKRLFDIVFLYLCMPLSAATIPLDDGAKFKLWREAITSKIFAVYGTVIAVNLYIMFLDVIGEGIKLGGAAWIDTLFNLILMIGGALAASSGAKLFGQIIGASNDTGRNLGQTIYTGMMAAQATGGIARGAGRFLFGGKSRGGSGGGAAGGRSGGIPSLINKAGGFLLGNKYTKGLSAAKSLKDTLKGSYSENGGILGMAAKNIGNAYKQYKGRPTGENGLLGAKDLK